MSYVKCVVGCLLLLTFLQSCQQENVCPSDASLERRFQSHEADFARLIAMANEDSKVVRITHDFTWLDNNAAWPRPDSELGFSKTRWSEYRQLFDSLGIKHGLARSSGDSEAIFMLVWTSGLVTGGEVKGYCYSTAQLDPLVESLDNVTSNVKSNVNVYKKINDRWYIYYSKDY